MQRRSPILPWNSSKEKGNDGLVSCPRSSFNNSEGAHFQNPIFMGPSGDGLSAPFENEASHLNENFFKTFLGHDISMASAKSGYFSNKYVAEIFARGISNTLFMFVGPGSIWDSSRAPESEQIIGIEKFSAPMRSFTPSQLEERGCCHNGDQIVKQDCSLDI